MPNILNNNTLVDSLFSTRKKYLRTCSLLVRFLNCSYFFKKKMSSVEKAFASTFPKNFGYTEAVVPRGISLKDLLDSSAYIQSFPSSFTYSAPSSEVLSESQMYRSLLKFVKSNPQHKNFEQLLYPIFCVSIMKLKEASELDQMHQYIEEFAPTIPDDFRRKVDRFLSEEEVFNKFASLFSTQRFIMRVTSIEHDMLNKFLNQRENSQLRKRITDYIILERICQTMPFKETKVMFQLPEATKGVVIYQTKLPNSTQAAFSELTPYLFATFDNSAVTRFSLESPESDVISKHAATVTSISVSSKGSMVVSTDISGAFNLWTENESFKGQITRDPMICSCFAPQGGVFCVGCGDSCTYMYDASRLEKNRSFVGHRQPVTSVKFHPNCAIVGTTSLDVTTRLWDVRQGETVRLFFEPSDMAISKFSSCIAYSPDGKYVAFYAGYVKVADIGSQKVVAQREMQFSGVRSLIFSEDSKSLFIIGIAGEIKLFEFIEEGAPLKDVISLSARVTSASINRMNEIHIITSADIN